MSGMVFLGTEKLDEIREFYTQKVDMTMWLEQADCIVLAHGNLLLGFCQRTEVASDGIYTFFYDTKDEVDQMYGRLINYAEDEPKHNPKYEIYHFFARDPEGRRIEFQHFDKKMEPFLAGTDLLMRRRSIRHFEGTPVSDEMLIKVMELCRYPPTANNRQNFYFVTVTDKDKLAALADVRGTSTAPIARAPMAVAVCSNPKMGSRYIEDADIASYHLLLAAWLHGLGTCWMGGMDQDVVKETLRIPQDHFVSTVTPLGWPEDVPTTPTKRLACELFHTGDKLSE